MAKSLHALSLELVKGEEVYRLERAELVSYLYQKLHLIPLELSITTQDIESDQMQIARQSVLPLNEFRF